MIPRLRIARPIDKAPSEFLTAAQFIYSLFVLCGFFIFPVVLFGVMHASKITLETFARPSAYGMPMWPLAVFVGFLFLLFVGLGAFGVYQLRRMSAGYMPWPFPRDYDYDEAKRRRH